MSDAKPANTTTPPAAAPSRPPPQVSCPTCKTLTLFAASNPWRPFCSERCRQRDFGAWASEGYRVAAVEPPDDLGNP